MVKYPTFPKGEKFTKKDRKKIVSNWKEGLSEKELAEVETDMRKQRNKKNRHTPDPVEATPSGFTKDELTKTDWNNT